MSNRHGILLSWIDSIQSSNNLSFKSIDKLYELYSQSNYYSPNPMSIYGFRRIINQIIDWKLNTSITKNTTRTNNRNITTYFISSPSINQKQSKRYMKYKSNIDESLPMRPSNSYTGAQLSHRHISITSPNNSSMIDMPITPSVTSPSVTSPSITSPAYLSPGNSSPIHLSTSTMSQAQSSHSTASPSSQTHLSTLRQTYPILMSISKSSNLTPIINSIVTKIIKYTKENNRQIDFNYTSNGKKRFIS